jgi:hypothetical protein
MVIQFRFGDELVRRRIFDRGLGDLYASFEERGLFEDAKKVTTILVDKIEHSTETTGLKREVESIIRGGKDVCRR